MLFVGKMSGQLVNLKVRLLLALWPDPAIFNGVR